MSREEYEMDTTNQSWLGTSNHHCGCGTLNCPTRIALFSAWRKLWEQHVMWTRSLIISKVDRLGDANLVATRLLRNPHDMGYELSPYFKSSSIDLFVKLFEEHLLIAAKLVDAAIAGNSQLVEQLNHEWFKNADDIAQLMHEFFPFESKESWQAMMHEHLKLTKEEAVLRIGKKYAENVAIYDTIETQALEMADMIASGIIKSFFKRYA